MALSAAQIESVREMVGDKTFATIELLCADLNAAQEAAMSDDIDEWDRIKNKHLRMAGGSDGLDIDNERSRNALRRRVRLRLDLPIAGSNGGLFQIPVGMGYADACDW